MVSLSEAQVKRFTDYLFDREDLSSKAARILRAIPVSYTHLTLPTNREV